VIWLYRNNNIKLTAELRSALPFLRTYHDADFSNIFVEFLGASPTSLDFLKIAMIQDMVWIDFSVSDLKLQYIAGSKVKKIKSPLTFIGDIVDSV
jgi:hypothetical protein